MPDNTVIIQAPMSYTGAARRIWRLTGIGPAPVKIATVPAALIITVLAFVAVTIWYCFFGLLVVPYRLLRRSSRKAKRAEAIQARQHAELLAAMQHSRSVSQ